MRIKNKYNIILAILCVAFFFVYAYLAITFWLPEFESIGHLVFNWPDSSANYFFANNLATSGSMIKSMITNMYTDNLIHARSINVIDTNLVPMTFLPAIMIWGVLFKVVNQYILLLTPALASITVYLYYRLVRRVIGSREIGFWSALLLLPLAPWLYFANISMLPVILFIFMIVAGSLCLTISFQQNIKSFSWWTLGSLLIGLGLIIRPTESLWVLAAWALVTFWQRKQMSLAKYIAAIVSLAVMFGSFFYLNFGVYGSWLNIGYQNLQEGGWPTEFLGQTNIFGAFMAALVAPFGIDVKTIGANIIKYIVQLQMFHVGLAMAGALLILFQKKTQYKKYLAVSALISLLLIIYYGSWRLADPLVLSLNTISISYVRYFMPIYMLSLPLVAYFLRRVFYTKSKYMIWSIYLLLMILATMSIRQAFVTKYDGLIATKQTLQSYHEQFLGVQKIAEAGSFIYSERSDKVFFPYYHVIVPQGDLPLWERIAKIPRLSQVYYYTDQEPADLEDEVAQMQQYKLNLVQVGQVQNFYLYEIIHQ